MKKSLGYFFSKERLLKEKGEKVFGFTLTSPTFLPPLKRERILKFYPFSYSYAPSGGNFALRETLSKFYSEKHKISLKKGNIFVGNGGKEVLYILLQVLLEKGGEIILLSPYWSSYPRMVKMAGGKLKVFRTSEKDGFYPNVKKLAQAITPKTKALILNSPCNPTGRVLKEKDVEFLAKLSQKKKLTLISDEVYDIYDFENCYCSFLKFFHNRIFCVFSASKIFSLCGWRLGWGVGNQKLIKAMIEYQSNLSTAAHTLSQLLIQELFEKPEEISRYFLKNKKEAQKRRDLVVSFLEKKKINFIYPEGGIAIFIKIPKTFKNTFSFAEILLKKEKVSVAPGEIFGQKDYFRMNFALPLKDIKEGLKRIAKCYVK